jgi:DNA-binding PadR family transcriptional regulator
MSYDYHRIDQLFHSRIRFAATALLMNEGAVEFATMREALGATDGNLSRHMRQLEDAGYVEVDKEFVGRKPRTSYRITERGRKAFAAYLERLNSMFRGSGSLQDPKTNSIRGGIKR